MPLMSLLPLCSTACKFAFSNRLYRGCLSSPNSPGFLMSLTATLTSWSLKPPKTCSGTCSPPVLQMVLLIIGFLPPWAWTSHSWSHSLKKKFFFKDLFMCMVFCRHVCLYTMCVQYPWRPIEDAHSSGIGVTEVASHRVGARYELPSHSRAAVPLTAVPSPYPLGSVAVLDASWEDGYFVLIFLTILKHLFLRNTRLGVG